MSTTTPEVSCTNRKAEKKASRFEPISSVLERWEQHALFDISFNSPSEMLKQAA